MNNPTGSFRTLDDWLAWLEVLHPSTIELGLDRVKAVADRIGLNFGSSRIVVVGGTNGKGSVVTMLSSVLQASGKTVGTYMSPHIIHYNERVMLNGVPVSDEELCKGFAVVEEARQETSLTYFEYGTLCALVIFSQRQPDYIILEVGLGGRLDAVNIVEPELTILTNVALDHMDWLGDSREAIGFEKAGIFRKGKIAIYGEAEMPASVLKQAGDNGTPLLQLSGHFLWSLSEQGEWSWQGVDAGGNTVARYNLPATRFHLDNAASVLQALLILEPGMSEPVIHEGLKSAALEGRFEELSRQPAIVVDVAHNTHAVNNLIESLKRYYPDRKLHIVIAMLGDKDSKAAVQRLSELEASWYVGQLDGERGASSKILYNHLLDWGAESVSAFDSVKSAFCDARDSAEADDVVLVTGSFYTVAEVKELLSAEAGENPPVTE